MNSKRSVSVVVLNTENAVLLHKREDFRIWSLPGGSLNAGETWEEAAVRETIEETGYQVAIVRFVGEYSLPQMYQGGQLKYVFTARVVAGQPIQRGPETVKVDWFDVKQLPSSLFGFMRVYIHDALAGQMEPVHRTLLMPWWKATAIAWLIKLRNFRNWLLRRRKS